MKKEISYTEAYNELQIIAQNLENGSYEVDELSAKIQRATELLNLCREKLRTIEEDTNEIINSGK
jgi:exodeoxyribonuclease VII small subunit